MNAPVAQQQFPGTVVYPADKIFSSQHGDRQSIKVNCPSLGGDFSIWFDAGHPFYATLGKGQAVQIFNAGPAEKPNWQVVGSQLPAATPQPGPAVQKPSAPTRRQSTPAAQNAAPMQATIAPRNPATAPAATDKPNGIGAWSLDLTLQALGRPIPPSMLKTKKLQGNQIPYLPWHTVIDILNKYAPGWSWEITQMHTSSDRLFLVGRLTLVTSEGTVYQEATGTEELDCSSYGDPSSNAESMCLRRAAAKFGLALDLYKK